MLWDVPLRPGGPMLRGWQISRQDSASVLPGWQTLLQHELLAAGETGPSKEFSCGMCISSLRWLAACPKHSPLDFLISKNQISFRLMSRRPLADILYSISHHEWYEGISAGHQYCA